MIIRVVLLMRCDLMIRRCWCRPRSRRLGTVRHTRDNARGLGDVVFDASIARVVYECLVKTMLDEDEFVDVDGNVRATMDSAGVASFTLTGTSVDSSLGGPIDAGRVIIELDARTYLVPVEGTPASGVTPLTYLESFTLTPVV